MSRARPSFSTIVVMGPMLPPAVSPERTPDDLDLLYLAAMSYNAPAGWYRQDDGTERWWDGQAWTAHARPVPPAPTAPLPAAGSWGHDGSGTGLPQQHPGWTPAPMGYAVAPKNPAVSLLASFFIPGLGTMLNGEVGKGIGILVGYFVSLFLFFLIVPLLIALGIWVWGMVDAYQGAQQWNRRHGILS
jgi:TM2 domain-containing membrane protein YozV